MNFLKYDLNLQADQAVVVTIDRAANVFFVDRSNFYNYQHGRGFRYYGGNFKTSPVHLKPPHSGHWHLIVDLGGYAGRVNVNVEIIPG